MWDPPVRPSSSSSRNVRRWPRPSSNRLPPLNSIHSPAKSMLQRPLQIALHLLSSSPPFPVPEKPPGRRNLSPEPGASSTVSARYRRNQWVRRLDLVTPCITWI
jgi:hypothetical protein